MSKNEMFLNVISTSSPEFVEWFKSSEIDKNLEPGWITLLCMAFHASFKEDEIYPDFQIWLKAINNFQQIELPELLKGLCLDSYHAGRTLKRGY